MPKDTRVARLAWPEVERRIREGAAVLLPVGAACKEHGYHLPMQTDFLQAEWFAKAATTSHGVLCEMQFLRCDRQFKQATHRIALVIIL